jgi:hypothetical protein
MIPYLAIYTTEEENRRLRGQITRLKGEHIKEWELLRQQVNEIKWKTGLPNG